MKEARLRALTPQSLISLKSFFCDRNERSPFKGIDTYALSVGRAGLHRIEMKEARLRALTPHLDP